MSDEALAAAVLRAVRAEATRRAKTAVRDLLIDWATRAAQTAEATGSTRPDMTADGRYAAALRRTVDRLDVAYPEPGEQWSQVCDLDSVEVWHYPGPPAEPDPAPIRIVVIDGADNSVASAYLSVADARTHAGDLLALLDKIDREAAQAAEAELATTEVAVADSAELPAGEDLP